MLKLNDAEPSVLREDIVEMIRRLRDPTRERDPQRDLDAAFLLEHLLLEHLLSRDQSIKLHEMLREADALMADITVYRDKVSALLGLA
jgi:hypothetical protein